MARRPYEDQYWEEPRRGILGWFFWTIFKAPGKAILWWEYMFPKRGQVYASGRRYGNPIVEVITSIAFWFTIAYVALSISSRRTNSLSNRSIYYKEQAIPSSVQHQNAPTTQTPEWSDPSQTPNALLAAPQEVVVATYFANLRSGPTKAAPVIDHVDANEQLALIRAQGSWVEIRKYDNTIGWIHRSLIRPGE